MTTTTNPETPTITVAETLATLDRGERYDAAAIEEKWRARWERDDLYRVDGAAPRSMVSMRLQPPRPTKSPSSRSGTKGQRLRGTTLVDRSPAGLGGAEGTRTPYLHNAIVALSQMSYSPIRTPMPRGTPYATKSCQPSQGPRRRARRNRGWNEVARKQSSQTCCQRV